MKTKKAMFLGVIVTLILTVSLILPLGCDGEEGTKTYSKYGFSFEYPATFSVTEMGLLESEANDNSGMVQVGVENGEIEIFQVTWGVTVIEPDELEDRLVGGLEGGFEAFETEEGVESVERGELVESTQAGHLMFYQCYVATFTVEGKVYGVINCFYCDENSKFFSLMTMDSTISTTPDALEDFQSYLDSFVCH